MSEHEVVTQAMRDAAQAALDEAAADIAAALKVATSDLSAVLEQGLRNAADVIAAKRADAPPDGEPPPAA